MTAHSDSTDFFDLTRPNRQSLQAVIVLHLLESSGQIIALLMADLLLGLKLPYGTLWAIVAAYALWNVGSWTLLRSGRLNTFGSRGVLAQLLVGIGVLTALLYFSGGSTNPFVSLFLVPIALGATILRAPHAIALALISVLAYSALMVWYVPLAEMQTHHSDDGWNLHFAGMWLNYLVSALVVMIFLSLLARLSRRRAEQLSLVREQALRNEQIVTLGSVAAGAAHSLSTPLSTVAVLVEEMADERSETERQQTLRLAKQQLSECRARLSELTSAVGSARLHQARRENLREFLERLLANWLLTHPATELCQSMDATVDGVTAVLDPTLRHSILNLLDNAADASAAQGEKQVAFNAAVVDDRLKLEIADRGAGPPQGLAPAALATSTKPSGSGAGILLTRANLSRMGGSLSFSSRDPGCLATVVVPLIYADEPNIRRLVVPRR